MRRERRIALLLLGAGVLLVLIVAAIITIRESRSLYYTLVFENAQGLRDGDRVQLSGVNVGVVKWCKLEPQPGRVDVRVKIPSPFASNVRVGSTAIIHQASDSDSGRSVVEIINPDRQPPPPPLPRDSVVYGMNSPLGLEAWRLGHTLRGVGDALSQTIGALAEGIQQMTRSIEQITTSPETQRTIHDLQDFMRRMDEQGRRSVVELSSQWPRIKQELEPALKELQIFGRDYLVDQIRQMERQIDQTLRQWHLGVSAPTPSPTPPER